jgi:hypothetical protein
MKQEELEDKEEKGEGVVFTGDEGYVDCRFGKTGSSC